MHNDSKLLNGRYQMQTFNNITYVDQYSHYRALDLHTQQYVNVKQLAFVPHKKKYLTELETYLQSLLELNHNSLETYLEYFTEDGYIYVVSKEIPESIYLDHYLRDHSLSVLQVIELMISLAEGVEAASQAGVYHREISPSSIRLILDPMSTHHINLSDHSVSLLKRTQIHERNAARGSLVHFDKTFYLHEIHIHELYGNRIVNQNEYLYRSPQELKTGMY